MSEITPEECCICIGECCYLWGGLRCCCPPCWDETMQECASGCGQLFACCCPCCWPFICQSTTGSSVILSPFLSSIVLSIASVAFTLVTVFILGILQAFNPKGPFFLIMLAGTVLAVGLTGISVNTGTCKKNCELVKENVCNSMKTTWGRLTFVHSHHKPHLREAGHEFKIGNKYFCTGCYGTLIGTTIVLILMSAYVLFGLTADLAFLVTLAIPFCLIPITLRYAVFKQMRTPLRLLFNILLPIGAGLLFILCDYTFHSWFVNVGMVLLIVVISVFRVIASAKENSVPETLPIVLPVM
ncbi:MAG: hypothetical protein ACFFC7_15810 [Candidatus Hermodarchaeota archaeon]